MLLSVSWKVSVQDFFRSRYGTEIDLASESDLGQAAYLISKLAADFWLQQRAAYAAHDITAASNDADIDILCALNGVVRRAAQPAKVLAIASGDPGTVLPVGRMVSDSSRNTFEIAAQATLLPAANRTPAHDYAAGDICTYALKILYCRTPGTSALGDPAWDTIPGPGNTYTDGSVVWLVVGAGAAYSTLDCICSEAAKKSVLADTVNIIDTPISGWLGVLNPLDAYYPGSNRESNSELLARREQELHIGQGTIAIIKRNILALNGVSKCYCIENDSDSTVGGLPPHSIEVFVAGGLDADIASELFLNSKPAGIATYGSESVIVSDDDGGAHSVHFTRISESATNIYVQCSVTVDSSFDAVNGPGNLKLALINYGDSNYKPGSSVICSKLDAQCWLPGVVDVECKISLTPGSYARTTITTDLSHIPGLDTSRITVVVA